MELNELFFRYFIVSVTGSILISILCLFPAVWNRVCSARIKYVMWMLLTLFLIFPVKLPRVEPMIQVVLSGENEIVFQNTISEKEIGSLLVGGSVQTEVGEETIASTQSEKERIHSGNSVLQYIEVIWLIGSCIVLCCEVIRYLAYKKQIFRWSKKVKSEMAEILLAEIMEEYKISKKISIRVTENVQTPLVYGIFEPCIFIPNMDYTKSEMELILRHELLHYKRKDVWYKMLLFLVRVVHWFNPFIYVMSRHANADMERACDDAVLSGKKIEARKEYADVILATVKRQTCSHWSNYFYGGKTMLKERFENILRVRRKKDGCIALVAWFGLLVSTNFLMGCDFNAALPLHTEEKVISFAEQYVNEFQGTIARENEIELSEYIQNEALLNFAERMIVLTQKQITAGGTTVLYGADNVFYRKECSGIDENIWYVDLYFDYQGSGQRCQILVDTTENMEILDFYFGSMDGIDTICTGHSSERLVNEPEIWNEEEWVLGVFEKMLEYEGMLDTK